MKKLLFSSCDLCIGLPENRKARDLNIQLYKGETIAMLGLMESGRCAFTDYLSGKEQRLRGTVIFDGIRSETKILEGEIRKYIYMSKDYHLIGSKSDAENETTLMEYLFLHRKKGNSSIFWINKKQSEKAEILLQRVGLKNSPKQKVNTLSALEYRLLDFAKALDYEAKLILMREDFEGYDASDILRLSEVMELLKKQGITFVLETNGLKGVQALSDRLMLFRMDYLVKKMNHKEILQQNDIKEYLMESDKKEQENRLAAGKRKNVCYQVHNICLRDGKYINLEFHEGELVNLVDYDIGDKLKLFFVLTGEEKKADLNVFLKGERLPRNWKSKIGKYRIAAVKDMGLPREIFSNLSVGDNLLIPNICKLKKWDLFVPNGLAQSLKENWEYEKGKMPDRIEVLTKNECIDLILKRWIIFNPSVLVLLEPFLHTDEEGCRIIEGYLKKFEENGTSVIIISSSKKTYEKICGHYCQISTGTIAGGNL